MPADFLLDETEQFTPSTAYSEMTTGVPEIQRGIYSKSKNTTTNVSTNVRVTYNNVYAGKHNLTLGANIDYYLTQLDNVSITGYGVGTIKSAAAINQSIQGTRKAEVGALKDKNAQLGFGAVVGYTFVIFMTFMVLIRLTLPLFCLPTNAGTVLGQWGLVGLLVIMNFCRITPF